MTPAKTAKPQPNVDHEESAVEALRLREGDVGHDTATEEHQHRRAHEFREEQYAEIVHVDLPSFRWPEGLAQGRNTAHHTQAAHRWGMGAQYFVESGLRFAVCTYHGDPPSGVG